MRLPGLFLLVTLPLPAQNVILEIAPSAENRISLEVAKTGLLSGKKHLFVLEKYSGRVELDKSNPDKSRVELTMDPASLLVKDDWLSAKDAKKVQEEASVKMLAVNQFREMTFRSTSVRSIAIDRYTVEGMLTIRGIARPVTLEVTMRDYRFEGSGVFKMSSYGLKPPSAALGAVGTKDEMTVRFQLVATPRPGL